MSEWRTMDDAPKDGTGVDLWGYDRDPEERGGILLPKALGLHRWTDCFWGTPHDQAASSQLIMRKPAGWYRTNPDRLHASLWQRIWPTHWMPVPGKPGERVAT